ncbi:MAG: hypothetical protein AAF293_00175 [Pseudomonadota bacterium]
MPIYLENKGVVFGINPARHLYLVYVPDGEQNNYAEYRTIGAFAETPSSRGPWGLLEASRLGTFLADTQPGANKSDAYPVEGQSGDIRSWATAERNAVTVYSGAAEATIWQHIIDSARALGGEYTYKASQFPLVTGGIWGPTVNSNAFIVSSLLNTAKREGITFDTTQAAQFAPGKYTWLGTSENDDMSLADPLARDARMETLYGGKGADTLSAESYSANTTIVAGDDSDTDVVKGGAFDDTLVIYYNQAALSQSDSVLANSGNDTILAIDPSLTLAGGIPDLKNDPPSGGGQDFTHGGLVSGTGGLIDGGAGTDLLSYRYVSGPVHLALDSSIIRNLETIELTEIAGDHLYVGDVAALNGVTVDGRGGVDRAEFDVSSSGLVVTSEPWFGRNNGHYRVENPDGTDVGSLFLKNFEWVRMTNHEDQANFQTFDENGNEVAQGIRITALGAAGNDTLIGTGGHDDLHGGADADLIEGGGGADILYDFGKEAFSDGPDEAGEIALGQDPDGDDTVRGGDGADWLIASGGKDTLSGGAGDDLYLSIRAHRNDHVTVVFSETSEEGEETPDWGHDYIAWGDADRVVFGGFDQSDVTMTFEYEEVLVETIVSDFDPIFIDWFFDPDPVTIDVYSVRGTVLMTLGDGSSLTVDGVSASYTVSSNPGYVTTEPRVFAPFVAEFDDGLLDWVNTLRDPNDLARLTASVDLPETAFNALTALQRERDVTQDTITGTDATEVTTGSNISELFVGTKGNDTLLGGGGADVYRPLASATDASFFDGGDGYDEVSFAHRTVGVKVDAFDPTWGEWETGWEVHSYLDVEAIRGTDHDDVIRAIEGNLDLFGGAGNDTLTNSYGFDRGELRGATMDGGAGDDSIIGTYQADSIDGGTGNDTIRVSDADTVSGGEGDDLVISYGSIRAGRSDAPPIFDIEDAVLDGMQRDIFRGGEGVDELFLSYQQYTRSGSANLLSVLVQAGDGTVVGLGGDVYTTYTSVENIATSDGNDTVLGDDGANRLSGMAGDDLIDAGGGDDVVHAGRGDDTVFGGEGYDRLLIRTVQAAVQFTFEDGLLVATIDEDHPDHDLHAMDLPGALEDLFFFGNNADTAARNDGVARIRSDNGTTIIHQDIEQIVFLDGEKDFAEVANGVVTDVLPVDDLATAGESEVVTLDVRLNDIGPNGAQFEVVGLRLSEADEAATGANGAVPANQALILPSGAKVTVGADGQIVYDPRGSHATLIEGEKVIERFRYDVIGLDGIVRSADVRVVVSGETGMSDVDGRFVFLASEPDRAVLREVTNFDIKHSLVVIDGDIVRPDAPRPDIGVQEIRGDTYVTKGDDAVILTGISLEAWQAQAPSLSNSGYSIGLADTWQLSEGDDIQSQVGSSSNGFRFSIRGLGGDDIIQTRDSHDILFGNDGDDILVGRNGDDHLNGGPGNDTVLAGDWDDEVFASSGIDHLDGGEGYDVLNFGSDGAAPIHSYGVNLLPTFFASLADGSYRASDLDGTGGTLRGFEYLLGGMGDDTLIGDHDANLLDGGDGNDLLFATDGLDTIRGGNGQDTISFGYGLDETASELSSGLARAVRINPFIIGASYSYLDQPDIASTISSVEHFFGSLGSDVLLGSNAGNTIVGWDGDDSIDGRSGRDTLDGGAGADTILGGPDRDVLRGGTDDDLLDGGLGNDTLTGDTGSDRFTFVSGDGTDVVLDFAPNEDTIQIDGILLDPGALPNGVAAIQNGADVLLSYGETDSLRLVNFDLLDWIGGDTITGTTGADTLTGTSGDDVIQGDAGEDLISGLAGADTILGGSQYDTIFGGAGDDDVDGGNGRDSVDLGDGADIFRDNGQTGTHAHDVVDGGAGDDTILGGGGDDLFMGGAGADEVIGGDGDDRIAGGTGDDLLTGGSGLDTFVFAVGDGADLVSDFQLDEDAIEVGGVVLDRTDLAASGATATQNGSDVLLSYGSADSVRLANQDVADWSSVSQTAIGQAGTATVRQTDASEWHTVAFDAPIADAVVVMGPVSFNGADPTVTRVRNISDTGFEFQLDEWDYKDGGHTTESVGWLALSEGIHVLESGQTIAAGSAQVGTGFSTISYGVDLVEAIVVSEVTTVADPAAVTTRMRAVTSTGFDVQLQEEEAADGLHAVEDVSWIAIEAGVAEALEAFRTPDSLTQTMQTFDFTAPFDGSPVLLADMQTRDGGDPAALRYDVLTATGASLFVEEEASKDSEIGHTTEVAGIVAIEEGLLY